MHLTSISVSLLAASSLAAAHPTQHTDDRLQSHSRSRHVPIHHIPAEYLSLFDPAKHEYLTAKLKAHQEAIRMDSGYGSKQQILKSALPTRERMALGSNMASIRAQCKHAAATAATTTTHKSQPKDFGPLRQKQRVVLRSAKTSEASQSSLIGATVFAIGAAIGLAILLV